MPNVSSSPSHCCYSLGGWVEFLLSEYILESHGLIRIFSRREHMSHHCYFHLFICRSNFIGFMWRQIKALCMVCGLYLYKLRILLLVLHPLPLSTCNPKYQHCWILHIVPYTSNVATEHHWVICCLPIILVLLLTLYSVSTRGANKQLYFLQTQERIDPLLGILILHYHVSYPPPVVERDFSRLDIFLVTAYAPSHNPTQ